jgi:hypothetical protein
MAVRASFGGFSPVTRASYFRFISALKRMAERHPDLYAEYATPNAAKIWRRRSRRFGSPNEDGRACPPGFSSGVYRKCGRVQKEYEFHVDLECHPDPEVWLNENIGPMKFVRVSGCPCSLRKHLDLMSYEATPQ